jgi:hypothetical protein
MLPCFLYRKLDWFKQTSVGGWFYIDGRYEHFGPVLIVGRVTGCEHTALFDGDVSFDVVLSNGATWHCEVTPCAPKCLRALGKQLKPGELVQIGGIRTNDPNHRILFWRFTGGGLEIHPVTAISRIP